MRPRQTNLALLAVLVLAPWRRQPPPFPLT